MMWRTRAVTALLLGLTSAACADGRPPPTVTKMVPVGSGLSFAYGLGSEACGLTLPSKCTDTEVPLHTGQPAIQVQLAAFEIDEHEVTNEQYRHCVETGPCSQPAKRSTSSIERYYGILDGDRVVGVDRYADYPVVHVRWDQASQYCAWVGKRLPTEYEFERVAAGAASSIEQKRVYPWLAPGPREELGECTGRDVNLYGCRKEERPGEVTSFSDDKVLEDGLSVWDLTGNVAEWTANDADPLATCDKAASYTCASCVGCVRALRDVHECHIECASCACGAGPPGAANTQCFQQCAAPLCVVPAQQPVAMSPPKANSMVARAIRGGSFAVGAGMHGERPCEGRADHRVLDKRHDFAGPALGFRCARTP